MKIVSAIIALLLVCSFCTRAQDSRYLVEFRDKKGTAFTLANPSAYLSAKAITRRTVQQIPIDSTDLPISSAYFDSIRLVPNVTIINKSNWLNQVAIKTTSQAALTKINSFAFVKSVNTLGAKFIPAAVKPVEKFERIEKRVQSPSLKSLANIYNYGASLNQIHIHNGEYLHNLQFNGRDMVIAVLDAGFSGYKTNKAFDSLRLQNRILGEFDFVKNEISVNEDDAHGTYCLSILTANRSGLLVGSAPNASFYLYRTEDSFSEYPIEEQNWVAGAERADSAGADMISSSLGYSDFDNPALNHSYLQRNGNFSVVTRGADLAARKGMIVMNSAGNSGAEAG
ncbi:MAG: S8 family serine peptidase, partial [Chitinophagaceae bacterium]